ncbi:hypothetical protein [Natrinema salinisoli]|uniref:hypothetical protein n=1 Tax=Natrinema salinisoli TaxID=2878535 RepID=UPI001CF09DE0|nr:hypothetical protein [Natrinema salinisoli]
MDTQRFKQDVAKLKQRYHVTGTDKYHGIVIHNFNYPTGWVLKNRRQWQSRHKGVPNGPNHLAPLIVQFPTNWPQSQPYVYIPEDMDYRHGRVEHKIPRKRIREGVGKEAAEKCPEGYALWCAHDLGLDPRKKESSIPGFLKLIMASFSYPDKDEPLRYVYNAT